MPKPKQFTYTKKEPFRDAFFFIVVCEGKNREPEYFRFFEGMSSRVKIVPVASSEGNSSPVKLINNAVEKEKELGAIAERDQVWFVIDTDRWREQIRELREECNKHPHWQVVQSNPCFEVWLYFHAKVHLPNLPYLHECNNWKPHLPKIIKGGFDTSTHPVAIETAIQNSKTTCTETGYIPEPGSTQLWRLGEALIPLIKDELERLKDIYFAPEIKE